MPKKPGSITAATHRLTLKIARPQAAVWKAFTDDIQSWWPNSSKKVTITVDQYASPTDASSAYQEAVQKSKIVPGFKPVSASDLGQNGFIGTVTQGDETHIGLGTLQGTLIVGATLVGYDPTPDNIAKLVSVTREEEAVAKAALDRKAQD
jgi:hypothetical protein